MIDWTEKTPLRVFEDEGGGEIIVFPFCPQCGRFIKTGRVLVNGLGEVKLVGWTCSRDGEVSPCWTRS